MECDITLMRCGVPIRTFASPTHEGVFAVYIYIHGISHSSKFFVPYIYVYCSIYIYVYIYMEQTIYIWMSVIFHIYMEYHTHGISIYIWMSEIFHIYMELFHIHIVYIYIYIYIYGISHSSIFFSETRLMNDTWLIHIHPCTILTERVYECVWIKHVSFMRVCISIMRILRMSHVSWMSHVSYTNESCLICEWVMSHIRTSHVSYVNESCLMYDWVMHAIYDWVMSHIWMSHVSYTKESCHMYEWVMSHIRTSHACHIWLSHVSYMKESRTCGESCLNERVMSYVWMSHVSYTNDSCLIYEWVMPHI